VQGILQQGETSAGRDERDDNMPELRVDSVQRAYSLQVSRQRTAYKLVDSVQPTS
jgi:hypothetical protein